MTPPLIKFCLISPQTFLLLQKIDPFYIPKFRTKSLSSIHSEYEFLYDMKPANYGTHEIECILEEGNVLEDKDVAAAVSASDIASQEDTEKKTKNCYSMSLGEGANNSHQSSCMSGNDDLNSDPYIDERSLAMSTNMHRANVNISESLSASNDSTISNAPPLRQASEATENVVSNPTSSSEESQWPNSGYTTESKTEVSEPELCNLLHPPLAGSQCDEQEEETDSKDDSESGVIPNCSSGVEDVGDSQSCGVEYLNYDSAHIDYVFTIGSLADCTNIDAVSLPMFDPNYVPYVEDVCGVH